MRRFLRLLSVAFVCGILVIPPVEAQNRRSPSRDRHSGTTTRPSTGNHGSRPTTGNSNSRPTTGNHGSRPSTGNSNSRPQRPSRPGNSNPGNTGRPTQGNNHATPTPPPGNNRPGQGNNRPGNNHATPPQQPGRPSQPHNPPRPNTPTRPGNPPRPHTPPRPAAPAGSYRPGPRPIHMAPPARPYRPIARPWTRPVPPPAWRPYRGCPTIAGILGLTFGTTISLSLNQLYSSGYSVDGYGPDVVYLRDVSEMSYIWPDATLYYGAGGLDRSEFVYSTAFSDMSRYNNVYNNLVMQYGSPVNYVNSGGSMTATWFGNGNGYISLQFGPSYSTAGRLRYYTTLTLGN